MGLILAAPRGAAKIAAAKIPTIKKKEFFFSFGFYFFVNLAKKVLRKEIWLPVKEKKIKKKPRNLFRFFFIKPKEKKKAFFLFGFIYRCEQRK